MYKIMKKLISIIIPVYNEEENIPLVYDELKKVCQSETLANRYNFEFIFVNDGSNDNSGEFLVKLSSDDDRVKLIEFSRNFGKEIATTAGINNCHGNAAIIVDADLQHPIELIPEFLQKWEDGAEVVVGVRKGNAGEGVIKKIGSYLFYKTINQIAETKITPNATDYRLIDKKVIAEFNRFTERNRITRGLIDWLGFKTDFIHFQARPRKAGNASYSYLKLTKLALSSFVSHSFFPLRLAGYLGVIITFFSGLLGLFIFVEKYILNDPWAFHFSWPAILAVINLFLIGIVLSCLGLIALYIANIHNEVTNRPMYVIRRRKS
jgi:dolichol-phosphate mannosyltransferase